MSHRDEYPVPASWSAKDCWDWITVTLQEPGVTSVEVLIRGTQHWFVVWFGPRE